MLQGEYVVQIPPRPKFAVEEVSLFVQGDRLTIRKILNRSFVEFEVCINLDETRPHVEYVRHGLAEAEIQGRK